MSKKQGLWTIATVVLFAVGIFVRLYNFPNRVTFSLEQGLTLSTTYDYLHGKFSLLGLPNVQRFTSTGLRIYSGPLYNYALMPVMKFLGYNPITLTYFALVINLITAAALYYLVKRLSGPKVAFFSTVFFLFSITMIGQSLTLWILNPLPLNGLLMMYLLLRYRRAMPTWVILALGTLAGVGVSLEWICLFTMAGVGLYLLFISTNKIRDILVYVAGVAIPLSPTIFFDFRHGWYHAITLWQYLVDTIRNPEQSKLAAYHLYQFYPAVFCVFGYVTSKLTEVKYRVGYLIAFVYVVYSLTSPSFSFDQAYGMGSGMTTPLLIDMTEKIAEVAGPYYNVVYMPNSEYRAYAVRYILSSMYNSQPMPIDAYPSSSELYVIAQTGTSFDRDLPWEIASTRLMNHYSIYSRGTYSLYKFTK